MTDEPHTLGSFVPSLYSPPWAWWGAPQGAGGPNDAQGAACCCSKGAVWMRGPQRQCNGSQNWQV